MNRLGAYVLLRRIGVGGMAEIFLARREGPAGFAKICALKRILPHLADQTDFVNMFMDEARLAARLSHPNIVQIYDFGHVDDAYYIAMEYVPGEDLLSILRQARDMKLAVPPVLGAAILAAACDALHHAHELKDEHGQPLGIVHRDVTPSNLLVSYDGIVKLADFGIAKAEHRMAHTAVGALKGKYAYMSPEHALGEPVDRRSDVFSLGVLGHELMTGKRLFHRESELKVLQAITTEPIPRPSDKRLDLPREIDAILLRALERDRTKRFPTARAFSLALEEFLLANGEAGAKLQIARFLRTLFGEHAAAERHRWAVGDLDEGERTDALAPSLSAAAPQLLASHSDGDSISLGDAASEVSGLLHDAPPPRSTGRTLLIASSVLALGAAAGIALFGDGKHDGAEAAPPEHAVTTTAPVTPRPEAPSAPGPLDEPQLGTAPASRVDGGAAHVARPVSEAYLSVTVTPAVTVLVDGEPLGAAPLDRRQISAGKHTVLLVGVDEGFRVEVPIDVAADATHEVKLALAQGKLALDVKGGGDVYDGKRKLGRAPLKGTSMTEGRYTLTLKKGKREKPVVVEIKAGKVTKLRETW